MSIIYSRKIGLKEVFLNVTGTDCLLQKRIENLYFYCIKCFFHGSKETQVVGKMGNS